MFVSDTKHFKKTIINYMISNYGTKELDYHDVWSEVNTRKIRELLENTDYELISNYFTFCYKNDLTFRHKTCGNEFNCSWLEFCVGRRCECCEVPLFNFREEFLQEYFKNKLKECGFTVYKSDKLDGREFIDNNLFFCTCDDCGEKCQIRVGEIGIGEPDVDGTGIYFAYDCPECGWDISQEYLYDHQGSKGSVAFRFPDLAEEWDRDLNGNKAPSDYNGSSSEIIYWTCPNGHPSYPAPIWQRTTYRTGCPICHKSHGELIVRYYLDELGYQYKPEYKFADCKWRRPLRFDFAVFDDDNNLILLIEYHGSQHYQPYERFGGIDKFEEQVAKDKIKFDYCEKNKIPLLIIPHWDQYRIGKILEERLGVKNTE